MDIINSSEHKMALHLLHLQGYSIFEQLQLEETLLRADKRNWCLINEGSPPAIVMGISGKPDVLINREKLQLAPLPVIKRFSGGGTVVVDENTLFVTFIFQKDSHSFPSYPEQIMKWTEGIYKEVFLNQEFALRENDYVIGNRKCGGNAQYIKKERWLHHTSFLWHFDQDKMDYLLHPPKTPLYRKERKHADFLCTLKEHFVKRQLFCSSLRKVLEGRYLMKEEKVDTIPLLETYLIRTTNLNNGFIS